MVAVSLPAARVQVDMASRVKASVGAGDDEIDVEALVDRGLQSA